MKTKLNRTSRIIAGTSVLAMILAVVTGAGLPSGATADIGPRDTAPRTAQGSIGIGTSIGQRTLSNEVSVTKFAYARRASAIRSGPHSKSRAIDRLEFLTSDGQALPYVALVSETRKPGRTWIEIRFPGRPNGQTGWVRATALGALKTAYGRLVVNRKGLRATLFDRDGKVRWRAPVGIGRHGLATPAGNFWITEKLRAIGGSSYGPYAFGTAAYAPHLTDWPGGGVIGIHGTNEPGLIPGRPSHGCIRLKNHDITVLRRKLDVGTPLLVR